MWTKFTRTAGACIGAGLIALGSIQGAMAEDTRSGRELEGTWLFEISIHQCATGTPIGGPFQSLLTFTPDGTFTETTDNPMFFPAVRGPGHGVWKATGAHGYKAASVAFVTLNGALVKAQTIAQTIDVNHDALKTTAAAVTFYNPALQVVGSACADATALKLKVGDFF